MIVDHLVGVVLVVDLVGVLALVEDLALVLPIQEGDQWNL